MLYDVGVTRNLCGHVLIEADHSRIIALSDITELATKK